MYTVEFNAKIDKGKITVPKQYHDKFNSDVKVILLKIENTDAVMQMQGVRIARGFGALSHRANPNLWDQEENAWERAVVENYDTD